MEFVVQHEECRCCMEIDRCRERMAQVEKDEECVTSHPGFERVCLYRWVLATAAIGLKTKQKKAYTHCLLKAIPQRTSNLLFFYVSTKFFLWYKMASFAVSTSIYIKIFGFCPPKIIEHRSCGAHLLITFV